MVKRPRTPPANNLAMDYQTADSENVLKRPRPFGISEEVLYLPPFLLSGLISLKIWTMPLLAIILFIAIWSSYWPKDAYIKTWCWILFRNPLRFSSLPFFFLSYFYLYLTYLFLPDLFCHEDEQSTNEYFTSHTPWPEPCPYITLFWRFAQECLLRFKSGFNC